MRYRLAAAVLILAVGLGVRAVFDGPFAKYAGVALYASLVYVLIPRLPIPWAATTAVAFCWLVEFAQLTPYPAELSERSVLARLVLGSTFNAPDLLWYAAGVAVTAAVQALARARLRLKCPQ